MFKLVLERAEETEIKSPTSAGSWKKQKVLDSKKFQENIRLCGSQQTVESSSRDGNTRPTYLPPTKPVSGQEATVRTGHGTTDWFKIWKGLHQSCILSPCLFNLQAEYIM